MSGVWLKGAAFAVCASGLVACSTEGILPASFLSPHASPGSVDKAATQESDRIVKLPASAADLDCPEVEITEGGAMARVGGAASSEVRYQFDITDVARECDPQGAQFALKVGIAGRLLIGAAGTPGAYSTTLHMLVKREIDGKALFEKTFSVAANTQGGDRADFHIVSDPILLPLTRARLDSDYSILVGFGASAGTITHHRARRRG